MQPDLKLLLARHGHAEANRPWTFLGRTDSPLSARGQAQSEALAAALAQVEINAVYTSPLQRAWQTADVIAAPHGLRPIADGRLIEQDFGAWEGLSLEEVKAQYAGDVAAWQQDALRYGPTEGENLDQLAARVSGFCDDVRQLHAAATVLVVAHGAVLNTLLCCLLNTPLSWLWSYRLDTGAVAEVELHGERATLTRLQQVISADYNELK
ncbi:MAG TPA: histidine phosphatase family protein [Anaerolineae bacterium]